MKKLLLLSVFVVATCGLVYELVAGTLASYLLGDSVTQFSTIIGVYLFSMGIGAWCSKFFTKNLLTWFVQIEILVGLVGGISSSTLFLLFEFVESFRFVLYLIVMLTGIMVGLEIPLLMRIMNNKVEFKDLVSEIFTFDYIGALLASIIFPLILVPYLGILRTSFLFGIFNIIVALVVCVKYHNEIKGVKFLKITAVFSILFLLLGFVASDKIMRFAETEVYHEKIIYSKSSPYQRIVVTKKGNHTQLYLNGNLQFNSADEYRYHESLVHPAMAAHTKAEKILVLGGGDGMAVREILKYNTVKSITLVDLDAAITQLFSKQPMLTRLNSNSLNSPKLKIINDDAFRFLKNCKEKYDMVIVDFPDPSNYSVGKLYSNLCFSKIYDAMKDDAYVAIQSTNPLFARKSFWCIDHTLESVGFVTKPYHTYIPSFGEWGFVLAYKAGHHHEVHALPVGLRYLNRTTFDEMTHFPADMTEIDAEINKLYNQKLVEYFEKEWNEIQ